MKKNRRLRRYIRNGLLILSVIVAMVLFVLASFQLCLSNIYGMVTTLLSGGYILAFWSANDDE